MNYAVSQETWLAAIDLYLIGHTVYLLALCTHPQKRKPHLITHGLIAVLLGLSASSISPGGSSAYQGIHQIALVALAGALFYSDSHFACLLFYAAGIQRSIQPVVVNCRSSTNSSWRVGQSAASSLLHALLLFFELTKSERQSAWALMQDIALINPARLVRLSHIKTHLDKSDLWRVYDRYLTPSYTREFTFDPTQRLFVVRAIARMALRPYIPIFLVESLVNISFYIEGYILGRLLDVFDAPEQNRVMAGILFVALLGAARIMQKQEQRINMWKRFEIQRIALAIELAIFRTPLTKSALKSSHVYRYGKFHGDRLVCAVVDMYAHASSLFFACASIYMVHCTIGSQAFTPAIISAAALVSIRLLRLAVDWTSRWFVLQPYDYIEEICASISSIKFYAWEKKYLDWAQTYRDDDDEHMYSIGLRIARRAISDLLSVVHATVKELATLVTIKQHLSTTNTLMRNSEMLSLRSHIHTICRHVQLLSGILIDLQSLRDSNRVLEVSLRAQRKNTIKWTDTPTPGSPAVHLSSCGFTWGNDALVLEDITLSIAQGEFVAVTGPIGDGKSSLLQAMCSEMELVSGEGHVSGKIGYVGQKPWIVNGTLRDNILFGEEYNEGRYNQVVSSCALDADISNMAEGDMTLIGDRGTNISGGQRARLALARAMYAEADIYLLDDPLSAVDALVSRVLVDRVLLGNGFLRGKMRILVTNNDSVLPFASKVVHIKDGHATVTVQTPQKYTPLPRESPRQEHEKPSALPTKQANQAAEDTQEKLGKAEGTTAISDDGFAYFFSICGYGVVVLTVGLSLLQNVTWHFTQTYLRNTLRVCRESPTIDATMKYLVADYAVNVSRQVLIVVNMLYMQYVTQYHCSPLINTKFFEGLLQSPLSFFDKTHQSQISTAFYTSTSGLCRLLPMFLKMEVGGILSLFSALYHAWTISPYILLILPPLMYMAAKFDAWFAYPMLILQKESTFAEARCNKARTAAIDGAQEIRLFGKEHHFMKALYDKVDEKTQYDHVYMAISALDHSVNNVLVQATTQLAMCVLLVQQRAGLDSWGASITSAEVNEMNSLCNILLPQATVIARIRDRLANYVVMISNYRRIADTPHEAPFVIPGQRPPESWPDKGKIEFVDYSMRYRNDLPRALDSISLSINPGEKIGVVGRTGAGKSSLTKALFRIVEPDSGKIVIDGIDIATLGLHDLRSRIGIIPQESALFFGSVRDNIDPLKEHTIEEIWAAIIKAQLVDLINRKEVTELSTVHKESLEIEGGYAFDREKEKRKKSAMGSNWCWRRIQLDRDSTVLCGGLNKWIEFEGCNFSIGQRQLVSLCRALLRTRKVLILDEATANVDSSTDRVMHDVIRREFKDSTVITIAHRLNTVMDSDRILVMDQGRVAELDTPANLLSRGGMFSRLASHMSSDTPACQN
ncbi:P-loop containing nucleoside triphosphate hydrolase protein [Martensiomyces pterosporus]|nr:P-loop containing nucleoside triphosphate hydrolase protein [Martensiomyces pterosporus]